MRRIGTYTTTMLLGAFLAISAARFIPGFAGGVAFMPIAACVMNAKGQRG